MSELRDLPHAEQLRLLDRLADVAAQRFALAFERRELLQYENNAVYLLTDEQDARYVLRVGAEGSLSAQEQASEVMWLDWLHAEGHSVPQPVRDAAGQPVTLVGTEAVPARTCVLFRWLEGEVPAAGISERQMASLGATTRRLHTAWAGFAPSASFTRPKRGWGSAFAANPFPLDAHGPLLERLASRLAPELTELEREDACLLHGDLHRDNVLLRTGDEVGFIDFEDCGFGHPLFDVASLLDSFRRRVIAPSDYPRARAAFLEGYGPRAGSANELTRQLTAFKALRDAITLRFLVSSRNENVRSWAGLRVAELVLHISGYLDGEPARV